MANLNLSEFGEKLFVADADHTFIWDTANAISKRVSRNSWLNSGTLTSDAPVTISQTWNAVGQTFTAFKVNAVSTNSASGSLLADFQLGGATKFKVDKASVATLGISAGTDNSALYFGGANYSISFTRHATGLDMGIGGDNRISFGLGGGQILLSGRSSLAWSDGSVTNTGTVDTILLRDSASGNTLALRNGAAAQTFNVYGTSSASNANYARLALTCGLDGNATISTQALGTGTAGVLAFSPGGSERMRITTAGNVGIGTTAPSQKLEVWGNSGATISKVTSVSPGTASVLWLDGPAGQLVTSTGNLFLTNQSGNGIIFETASIEKMRLLSNGNLGIGTTSPSSKLQVSAGDVEVDTIAKGVILKSPDGTRYRVTVANGGILSVAAV